MHYIATSPTTMKPIYSITILLITCLACVRPVRVSENRYSVNAALNDSTWFGTAPTAIIYELDGKRCRGKRFVLIVRTDLPYKGMPSTRKASKVTGCLDEDCYMTQAINIEHIPFKRGKYKLRKLALCDTINTTDYHYWQTAPGGGTIRRYGYQKNTPNWVRVNHIDRATNTIEGQFEATLTDTSKQVMRFRKGEFKIKFQSK